MNKIPSRAMTPEQILDKGTQYLACLEKFDRFIKSLPDCGIPSLTLHLDSDEVWFDFAGDRFFVAFDFAYPKNQGKISFFYDAGSSRSYFSEVIFGASGNINGMDVNIRDAKEVFCLLMTPLAV